MNHTDLCRGKRTDNGEWVEGYLIVDEIDEKKHFIGYVFGTDEDGQPHDYDITMVDPSTICRCCGKEYMDSEIAYEGDIFESQSSGDLMILRYGTFQAYCPVDKESMDSVGFYAECKGFPDMPIGDLHDYALKRGNIFDNPELLEVADAENN